MLPGRRSISRKRGPPTSERYPESGKSLDIALVNEADFLVQLDGLAGYIRQTICQIRPDGPKILVNLTGFSPE